MYTWSINSVAKIKSLFLRMILGRFNPKHLYYIDYINLPPKGFKNAFPNVVFNVYLRKFWR